MARAASRKRYHGYYSKAQWKFFFSNPKLRRYAKKKAHATQAARGGPKIAFRGLPRRKGVRKRA
jgi:hypothetical protein